MKSTEKIRVSLFLDRNTVEAADRMMKERGYRSRNEFYTAMINEISAEEIIDKQGDFLGEKFAKAMESYEEEISKTISKGLFRYAVHLEMIAKILADQYGYSEDEVEQIRREACRNVRRLRGKIPLEKILAGYYKEHHIEAPEHYEWNDEEIF